MSSPPPSATPSAPPAQPTVPPAVKGLGLVSLCNDFASEMVYPLLPALVTGPLGAGAAVLGALDGAADLTSAVVKWFSGRLADRRGWRRPLILAGYALAVVVRPVIALASAAWQVVGLRVVDRFGKGLRTPARDALIAAVTPPAQRGRAFGFHRAADHLGAVLGSLAAWALLTGGAGVRSVVGWSAVPGVVALVVLTVVLRKARPPAVAATAPEGGGVGNHPADAAGRAFWAPLMALVALVLARLPETLLLLRLQDLGVAVATIPLVWAGLSVVRSLASYPGGWLVDRFGPRALVAAGGLLFAGVSFALGRPLVPAVAVGSFLLLGLSGATESAERTLVAALAPRRTGRGFGAFHALTGFAALPAALVFGGLYQTLGAGVALSASAGTLAVAVILWLLAPLPALGRPAR